MAKQGLNGLTGAALRAAEAVVAKREEALEAAQAKENAARGAHHARAYTASKLHMEAMAQALLKLCLLGRADAAPWTAPRQLVGIEVEIEAYKQHAVHTHQMQAMAVAVYPGQALVSPAVYPGQVLASPAVYPGQVLALPAAGQAAAQQQPADSNTPVASADSNTPVASPILMYYHQYLQGIHQVFPRKSSW